MNMGEVRPDKPWPRGDDPPDLLTGTGEPYTKTQPRIADRCPACGAQSLFIGAGGWLTCGVIGCKTPAVGSAIADLLRERDEAIDLLKVVRSLLAEHQDRITDLRAENVALREAAAEVVAGVDNWNAQVQSIIGRQVDYDWGGLNRLRAALEGKP